MKIPRVSPLIIEVPKENNFHIEEGCYTGHVHKIVPMPRRNCHDCEDKVKIAFALDVPGKEEFTNLANAEFDLNLDSGSPLRRIIGQILGREEITKLGGKQIDLNTLVGKPADVEVEHIHTNHTDQYSYPFVKVCDIQAPGTLVKPNSDVIHKN